MRFQRRDEKQQQKPSWLLSGFQRLHATVEHSIHSARFSSGVRPITSLSVSAVRSA